MELPARLPLAATPGCWNSSPSITSVIFQRPDSQRLYSDFDADGGDDGGRALALRTVAVVNDRSTGVVDLPGLHLRLFQRAAGRFLEDRDHLIVGIRVIVEYDDDELSHLLNGARILEVGT